MDKHTLPATLFKTGQKMIPVPAQLFTEILPRLHNESQLRATLYTWYAIASKGSGQRYVYLSQLLTDPVLLSWITHLGGKNGIRHGLDLSCKEGIFLQLQIGEDDKILAPNDESGARLITDMKSESVAHHKQSRDLNPETNYERTVVSNVIEKYENEIGMLTPVIADMIAIAEQTYPTTWILEALDIAAQSNARSWKYVTAILARWKNEGKNNGNEETSRFSSRQSGREQNRYDSVIRKRADSDKS